MKISQEFFKWGIADVSEKSLGIGFLVKVLSNTVEDYAQQSKDILKAKTQFTILAPLNKLKTSLGNKVKDLDAMPFAINLCDRLQKLTPSEYNATLINMQTRWKNLARDNGVPDIEVFQLTYLVEFLNDIANGRRKVWDNHYPRVEILLDGTTHVTGRHSFRGDAWILKDEFPHPKTRLLGIRFEYRGYMDKKMTEIINGLLQSKAVQKYYPSILDLNLIFVLRVPADFSPLFNIYFSGGGFTIGALRKNSRIWSDKQQMDHLQRSLAEIVDQKNNYKKLSARYKLHSSPKIEQYRKP